MLFPGKFQILLPSRQVRLLARLFALLGLLLAAAAARAAAYYSSGSPTVATQRVCGIAAVCGGVRVATAAQLANQTLAADMYAATDGPVTLRLPLAGAAPAGYRAGMLVSNLGTVLSVQTLGTVTLRSYLDGVLQESKLVDASALQAALLTSTGDPSQLEFTSTKPFDALEMELGSALALGGGIRVKYAYGVEPTMSRRVTGYRSRFSSSAGQYSTRGCTTGINNPERAVDNDLTNYASFASLVTVNCPEALQVNLEDVSPAGYLAGFVVGGTNNLLNADLLGGLTLRTYRNGVEQQSASGASLLSLDLLPNGQQFVRFATDKEFDAVSIERRGVVTALDNLQLYYGTGVANTPPQQARSNWDNPAGHYQTTTSSVLCTACAVQNPGNVADNNLGNYATIQVGAGVANSVSLRMDLNGGGLAGNSAGVVLGRNSLLDAGVLDRITIRTLDASGNVLESRAGSSLLTLNTLPDGRQSVSFNSTRDFSSVSITMNGTDVFDTTNVYYAYADSSNGTLAINPPVGPLPVQLVSLAVRRLGGAAGAELTWTTASELHSASFVVERSANPAAGFAAVGQVAAAGSSSSARQYSLRDAEAAQLTGTLYYRLRQVDEDGTAALSKAVVLAEATALTEFSVYPNPGAPGAPVLLSASAGLPAGGTVSLYSSQGQLLRQLPTLSEGQASLKLPTTGLPANIYYVVLRDAAGHPVSTQRLQLAGQ